MPTCATASVEIGLRRSLGATALDVAKLFVLEACASHVRRGACGNADGRFDPSACSKEVFDAGQHWSDRDDCPSFCQSSWVLSSRTGRPAWRREFRPRKRCATSDGSFYFIPWFVRGILFGKFERDMSYPSRGLQLFFPVRRLAGGDRLSRGSKSASDDQA